MKAIELTEEGARAARGKTAAKKDEESQEEEFQGERQLTAVGPKEPKQETANGKKAKPIGA